MATIDAMTTEIRRYLGNQDATAITDAVIFAAINSAIDMLELENPWFAVAETNFVLDSEEPDITTNAGWPTDFLSELPEGGLSLDFSDTFEPLTKIGVREYNLRDDQSTGTPHWYTVKDDSIHVLPYPDTSVYTLYLTYYKTQSDLATGQSNDYTANGVFYRCVKYMATADLQYDERNDKEKYAIYMARAGFDPESGRFLPGGLASKLNRLTNQKRSGGRIVPNGVLAETLI